MGGIPYTSTGCNTCRRRKVKCDETKPECLRCTKYGHQCTGYDRKKALVRDHTGSAPKKAQRIIPISEQASVDGMEIVPRQNLNPELRTQLIATFIESYLPSSPYLPNSTGLNVIQSIPELTGVSTMLEKAVISFSAVHLAKQNHDDRLLHYSSKLYGITLRTLNSRLRVGSKLDQDILYTTVILQFYEMIHCSPSGFMAWIAHVQGSLAVLGQYSGLGKGTAIEKLFHRQLKYVTICDAVVKRKAPYLYKTPAWRGLSSQGDTEPDPLDEFIDQLAECSALLERVDRFFHMQSISSEKANESGDQLLLACLSFEDNLHRLCLSMQGKLGLPMTSSHVATRGDFQDSLHTDLFCGILDFPSLPCAESHLLYWAILVLLYPLIGQLSSFLGRPAKEPLVHIYCDSPSGEAATAISLGTDATTAFAGLAEHYADEICRSVFYFIQPDMKVLGAQMLLAPLSQCVQFYAVEQSAGKLKWSQDVLMTLSHLGLGIAPFLNNIIWPQYLSAQTRKMSTTLQSSNS